MKKFISLIYLSLALSLFPLHAEKVDADRAGMLAQRHVQSNRGLASGEHVRLKYTATQRRANGISRAAQDTVFYYVFNISEAAGGGFVIVSGDDAVTPILAYSEHGTYDENNLPPNFVYWMDNLQDEIRWAIANKLPQSENIRQKWNDEAVGNAAITTKAVEPLLRTKWSQSAPYSDLCPLVGGKRSVTGCVATAMAQIMNYHRHPARGSGQSVAYTTSRSDIHVPAVSFAVNYDWNNMLNTYSETNPSQYTQQQRTAIATLMYHCGVSVKMDYSPNESGAYGQHIPAALSNYFGYDKNCSFISKGSRSTAEWESMIKEQLDAGLPVYYQGYRPSGGGHAFVCEGYRDDGTFYFNWGWNGSVDGWFPTSALPPQANYNSTQSIVINIKPDVNVSVTGVSLNKTSVQLSVDGVEQLIATVAPATASNKNVSWSSSSPTVAAVSANGTVTGISEGTATITVSTQDGAKTAYCSVTVQRSESRDNADLNVLTVNPGALSPAFNAAVTAYTVNLVNAQSTITVAATPSDSKAGVAGAGAYSLNEGANTISVTVTAQDGITKKTYTITVHRQAANNNADLSFLTVNRGELSPAFNAAQTAYSLNLDNNVASITLSAMPADANATVSGTGVHFLNVGTNSLSVEVTAQDGVARKTYTISVLRSGSAESDDIYVTGTEFNGRKYVAKYWKNGAPVTLSDGERHAETMAIAVVGNDVYVAGYADDEREYMVATYWKNGAAVSLTDGKYDAIATGVFIYGNDVYVSGYEYNARDYMVAKYWKNGEEIILSDGLNYASARDIFVYNGEVYVAGFERNANGVSVAKYWKNGTAFNQTRGNRSAYGRAITISDGDIYLVGEEYNGSVFEVKYWKNGEETILPGGYQGESIAISRNDVYVAGFDESPDDTYIAKYWTNGVATLLSDGARDAYAKAIAVSGNDVYVAGYERSATNYNDIAKYWKNGVAVALTDGSMDAAIQGMVVVAAANVGNNADLSLLNVNQGALSPMFSVNVTAYSVAVANSAGSINITAMPADANAAITGAGVRSLNVGSNIIPVEVTARDGVTKKTYTLTVFRAEALSADPYEPNDTQEQANTLAVSFSNNIATVKTTGANFHTETDVDYYKIDLPSGYAYTITARLHDAQNSANGNTYTVDALFSYINNGVWSFAYDDTMPEPIKMPQGGTLYFFVCPYTDGEMGTYLLDMTIERVQTGASNDASLGAVWVNQQPAAQKPGDAVTWQITIDYTANITIAATANHHAATIPAYHLGGKTVKIGMNIFEIAVTAENGNIVNYCLEVTVKDIASGAEDGTGLPLIAYPNPAREQITISGLPENGVLRIFDASGRQWMQRNIESSQETIFVSHLPQGAYILQVVEDNHLKIIKIIIN